MYYDRKQNKIIITTEQEKQVLKDLFNEIKQATKNIMPPEDFDSDTTSWLMYRIWKELK